jgi:hypothetical protein
MSVLTFILGAVAGIFAQERWNLALRLRAAWARIRNR